MSDTIKGSKGCGYEYWKGRRGSQYMTGPTYRARVSTKRETVRWERRKANEAMLTLTIDDEPPHLPHESSMTPT
jgi:hypothetical protein